MPVPKGKRYGGRQKGTRNKKTAPIREAIAAHDPIGRLFDLAKEARDADNLELEMRTLIALLPYGFPRLAASQVDLKAALMPPTTLNVNLSKTKKK